MEGYLTTIEAAEQLGISDARIRQLIRDGKLKAEKLGRDNFIHQDEVTRRKEAEKDKGGRPKKEEK